MSRQHWTLGEHVLLRRMWHESPYRVTSATVVEDSPDLVALFWGPGYPLQVPKGELTPMSFVTEESFHLRDSTWSGTNLLMLVSPGAAHAVYAMWRDDFAHFLGWYINLQAPLQRTPWGFDTTDYLLDIGVSPDRSSWRWKDEEEFAAAVQAGMFSDEEACSIRAEGKRALKLVREGPSSYFDAWQRWRPPHGWNLPIISAIGTKGGKE